MSPGPVPIPPNFTLKKEKILAALAAPSHSYIDLSPKGSVDLGIKDLIDRINAIDGIVTTSSCAGRISVFLEGIKTKAQYDDAGVERDAGDEGDEGDEGGQDEQEILDERAITGPVGGKGRGGRWLFVSHDPIEIPLQTEVERIPLSTLFGLTSSSSSSSTVQPTLHKPSQSRLVRFQFEPMILHILTASLSHARKILTAALAAGFRESGLSSLRTLSDPLTSFPTVAVRSSGLALSSLIGIMHHSDSHFDGIKSLVNEEYFQLLVSVANERFVVNAERIKRFSEHLFAGLEEEEEEEEEEGTKRRREGNTSNKNKNTKKKKEKKEEEEWEDREVRMARKREEGLKIQAGMRNVSVSNRAIVGEKKIPPVSSQQSHSIKDT